MEKEIYVQLLDEGTISYRPVKALLVDGYRYKIIAKTPSGEIWEFKYGDIVICQNKTFSNGVGLLAINKV